MLFSSFTLSVWRWSWLLVMKNEVTINCWCAIRSLTFGGIQTFDKKSQVRTNLYRYHLSYRVTELAATFDCFFSFSIFLIYDFLPSDCLKVKLAIGMQCKRVVVDGLPMFDWASYLQFIDCRTQHPRDIHYKNPNLNPREWNKLNHMEQKHACAPVMLELWA